jgi:methionine--tRNA ligase beta chain
MTEGIVEFSDWEKIDLRVGQILKAEDIEGADKLYKLTVDLGSEIGERIVCAGIKKYYSKEELVGKKVILFVNLTARKMKGIESQGMILAAVDEEKDSVVLLSPEKDIDVGSRVR